MARYDAFVTQTPTLSPTRGWLISALTGSLVVHLGLFWWFNEKSLDSFVSENRLAPPQETLQRVKIYEEKKPEEIKAVIAEAKPTPEKKELIIPTELPRPDEISVTPQHKPLDPAKMFGDEKPQIEIAKVEPLKQTNPDDFLPKLEESFFNKGGTGPKVVARTSTDSGPDGDGSATAIQVAGQNVEGILSGLAAGTGTSRRLSLPGNLTFAYDAADVSDDGRTELEKIAEAFRKYLGEELKTARFIIEGHTDPTGTAEYNQRLSERRAESVRTWFIEKLGLDPTHVTTRGYGATRPAEGVPLTGTPEEMQGHRRTEIIVRRKKKP